MPIKELSKGCSAARQHKVIVRSLMQCTYSLKSTVISKDVESSSGITCVTSTLAACVLYGIECRWGVYAFFVPGRFFYGDGNKMDVARSSLFVDCLTVSAVPISL